MLLGVQVSIEGKIYAALARAKDLDCNTMQIFSRNPQRWRDNFLAAEDIATFNLWQEKFKIKPLFIHIPYLINLASPDEKLYKASIRAYIEDIREADRLKAEYIVTHMGSHKRTSEAAGLGRLTRALNIILEKTQDTAVGVLLENTAGSGSWLGYQFIHQQTVLRGVKSKRRIGLCFDTAHAYAAGYDLASPDGLERTLREIDHLLGINLIRLIHLNDSQDKLGSRHDRHAHIGQGKIGLKAMQRILNHPKLKNIPFILETPKTSAADDLMNLKTVRKLRKS